MAFPTSNLPTSAVPWGREVEKQITTVASTVSSNEVNNAARDNQLAASLTRVQAAQAKADAAFAATGIIAGEVTVLETDVAALETNVYFPGTTTINGGNIRTGTIGATQISASYVYAGSISANQITTGTLNANIVTVTNLNASSITSGSFSGDRITGGTITGSTISGGSLSTSGSTYVNISGTSITFNYNGSSVGSLYGSYNASSGKNGIIATTNLFAVMGELGVYDSVLNLSNSSMYSPNFGGTIITAAGTFRGLSFTGTNYLQSENYSGGGTTGASINNNGTIIRTTSSARYKQDIEDLSVNYSDLLSLVPKRFRLKDEAETDENARYYAGFIAEEIDATSLKDFVGYQKQEDGTFIPDSVFYGELTAALLSGLKHQDSLIKTMADRITALENK